MAAAAVVATTTNTRVDSADTNTNYGHFGGSGQAPASEAPLAYQNAGAVNKKNTSTAALQGIDYDPASGAVNATSTPPLLWIAKTYISDFADLNATYGHSLAIGSSNANYKNFNVAGSGEKSITGVYATYPAAGGYLITAIDVNLGATSWDNEVGTTDETAIDFFGVQTQFINGVTLAGSNQAIDAIDMGTGLELHAGDGASADGSMQDLVDADEGTVANRWGYVTTKAGIIFVLGRMDVGRNAGSAAITEFTESSSTIVIFPDGYFTAGSAGMLFDIGNASSIMTVGCQFLGKGGVDANTDSRPDHVIVGTSGAYTFTGLLANHRNVTFTSVCDVAGTIECKLLTQGSANIENAKILTSAITSVACLQDPIFGTTTDLNNTIFEQGSDGVGHAIELNDGTLADAAYDTLGTLSSGVGAITPAWPTHVTDDIAFLICETKFDETPTLSTPAGFTLVESVATADTGAEGTRLTVWWHRATSGAMTDPTIADPGDHAIAFIETFSGCRTTGNPWDAYTTSFSDTASTSFTHPSVTTLFDGQYVYGIASHGRDSASAWASGQTNAGLASITEQADVGAIDGDGGGIATFTATDTLAGATGTTAVTDTGASPHTAFTFALANEEIQYTMTNITFTGYGADGTADAAVDITDAAGQVVINLAGGSTPTVTTAGAGWRTVNTVTLTINCLDQLGVGVASARVRIQETDGTLVSQGTANGSGVYADASYNYTSDTAVEVIVRKASAADDPKYKPAVGTGTIVNTGISLTVTLIEDTIA